MNKNQPVDFLQKQKKQEEDKSSKKRTALLAVICILIVFGLAKLTFTALPSNASGNPQDYNPVTLEPKEPEGILNRIGQLVFEKERKLAGHKEDRINILLLGMGGPGHDGPYLTDTIIIASIKPSTQEIAMVSIPRDLGVKMPEHGVQKINHANAYGEAKKDNWGGAYTTKIIEDTFDIDINYYARVDFEAFTEVIDKIGGIKVNIERSFVDSEYPAANNKYQTVRFEKGIQKMDGERALKYARSRHGGNGQGSDFARAERQQKVILAAKKKVLSLETLTSPKKIHSLMNSVDKHLTTNMKFSEIIEFVKMAKDMNIKNISTLVLDSSHDGFLTSTSNSKIGFMLKPKTGDFKKINKTIDNIFNYEKAELAKESPKQTEPENKNKKLNIEIQNGTWQVGLAARTKSRLKQNSLIVEKIGNTKEKPVQESGIYNTSNEDKSRVLNKIKKDLNIPIKKNVPEVVKSNSSTDVLVILGEDFKE